MSATSTASTAIAKPATVEPVDDEIVREIVDDVLNRAKKNGFSIADRDNARYLAGESARVLGLDASEADLEAATDELW